MNLIKAFSVDFTGHRTQPDLA